MDLRLIELVEKCSHLYDKSSPDYKDKIKAQNAWVSIAKLLNASVADCEHRWGQLRERFIRERRTLKTGLPSGSGSSKKSPSDLYKVLQFLEPHIQSRRTRGNILKKNLPSSEESTWDTLENDDPDVFEYLKNVEKNKFETQVTNDLKKSDNLLSTKIEPLENNINLLNVKTSVLNKTVNSVKKKKTINSEDDTLQIVSEALQSVKGCVNLLTLKMILLIIFV